MAIKIKGVFFVDVVVVVVVCPIPLLNQFLIGAISCPEVSKGRTDIFCPLSVRPSSVEGRTKKFGPSFFRGRTD